MDDLGLVSDACPCFGGWVGEWVWVAGGQILCVYAYVCVGWILNADCMKRRVLTWVAHRS